MTYASSWVEWELEQSLEARRPLIAMGLKSAPERVSLPYALLAHQWWGWDYRRLCRMIESTG